MLEVSYCSSCRNRLHQLRHVFDANIASLRSYPYIQWVLYNYSSSDGLDEYIIPLLPRLPSRFKYIVDSRNRSWNLSVAKNLAHAFGDAPVLMNLDCDNLILDSGPIIQRLHENGGEVVHYGSNKFSDGTSGRISINRDVFEKLGGYDEDFLPMGYQDLDLLARFRAMGGLVLSSPVSSTYAIQNSKIESMSEVVATISWQHCNEQNYLRSSLNIATGKLCANSKRIQDFSTCQMHFGGANV